MGTRIRKLPTMSKVTLDLILPLEINLEDLDGITLDDVVKHLNFSLSRTEYDNHIPFENQMLSHALHSIIKSAINGAIQEKHQVKYPGYVHYKTECSEGETAKWILTSKRFLRRIQAYFTGAFTARVHRG